jgi:hypothetical protein
LKRVLRKVRMGSLEVRVLVSENTDFARTSVVDDENGIYRY